MNRKQEESSFAPLGEQAAHGKQPYIPPMFRAIPVEQTSLICTSVPVSQESDESDYEDKGDREGDDFEIDLGF